MKHNKCSRIENLSKQEIYQIAKKHESANQLRKKLAAQAEKELIQQLYDIAREWANSSDAPKFDYSDVEPLTESIALPKSFYPPEPKNAFGIPIRAVLN